LVLRVSRRFFDPEPTPEAELDSKLRKWANDTAFMAPFLCSMVNPRVPGEWVRKFGHRYPFLKYLKSHHFNYSKIAWLLGHGREWDKK
jgi:hypothetical protein